MFYQFQCCFRFQRATLNFLFLIYPSSITLSSPSVIHAQNVDVVNLFHDVKDFCLTNSSVHRWISPVAIAKI